MNGAEIKWLLQQKAFELGFAYVGVSVAQRLDEEARRLEAWLSAGYHGKMGYMEQHFDMRVDPRELVPGARSVVTLVFNYHSERRQEDAAAPKLSQFAYGMDYHIVLKRKLKELLSFLQERVGSVAGRCFVDSAPILEREWAKRSGAGWLGKNTLLINPKRGSWFFLAELIIDLDLPADGPMKDYCGTCRRCIEACPTEAIAPEGYLIDASRCISYLTIELRDQVPEEFSGKMDNWMFGCDVCQDVCPWNRFSSPHNEPDFEPHPDLLLMRKSDWVDLTEEVFREVFRQSAVKRTKYEGLKRNIRFLKLV